MTRIGQPFVAEGHVKLVRSLVHIDRHWIDRELVNRRSWAESSNCGAHREGETARGEYRGTMSSPSLK